MSLENGNGKLENGAEDLGFGGELGAVGSDSSMQV